MRPLEVPLVRPEAQASFRRLVVGLFGFRRKQMLRALRELTGWPPPRAAHALERAAIPADLRPEALAPAAFVALHTALVDEAWAPR
jgi:16S rRNA A1518/A1519 N6-dimethyltransferase RsmA/KsgA/DIM1 with predicted DNA glycosylase/AP lyase activity